MKWRQLQHGELRSFALVLDTGDEVVGTLTDFAAQQRLSASRFTGLGALRNATLGYFDWERKDYTRIHIDEQVEVVSFVGDVTLGPKGGPKCPASATSRQVEGFCERRVSGSS